MQSHLTTLAYDAWNNGIEPADRVGINNQKRSRRKAPTDFLGDQKRMPDHAAARDFPLRLAFFLRPEVATALD